MDYLQITKDWIEQFVIKLNLCPFAAHPFKNGKIKYRLEETNNLEVLRKSILEELNFLVETSSSDVETTFLIHPNVLNEFLDYNDFLAYVNELLQKVGLEGEIQIASFHPEYQFADVGKEDISNFVTRSPFPMLHFLREEMVESAIQAHPNTDSIPFDNMEKLEEFGKEAILEINDKIKRR